jgi:hypothetical protein
LASSGSRQSTVLERQGHRHLTAPTWAASCTVQRFECGVGRATRPWYGRSHVLFRAYWYEAARVEAPLATQCRRTLVVDVKRLLVAKRVHDRAELREVKAQEDLAASRVVHRRRKCRPVREEIHVTAVRVTFIEVDANYRNAWTQIRCRPRRTGTRCVTIDKILRHNSAPFAFDCRDGLTRCSVTDFVTGALTRAHRGSAARFTFWRSRITSLAQNPRSTS